MGILSELKIASTILCLQFLCYTAVPNLNLLVQLPSSRLLLLLVQMISTYHVSSANFGKPTIHSSESSRSESSHHDPDEDYVDSSEDHEKGPSIRNFRKGAPPEKDGDVSKLEHLDFGNSSLPSSDSSRSDSSHHDPDGDYVDLSEHDDKRPRSSNLKGDVHSDGDDEDITDCHESESVKCYSINQPEYWDIFEQQQKYRSERRERYGLTVDDTSPEPSVRDEDDSSFHDPDQWTYHSENPRHIGNEGHVSHEVSPPLPISSNTIIHWDIESPYSPH